LIDFIYFPIKKLLDGHFAIGHDMFCLVFTIIIIRIDIFNDLFNAFIDRIDLKTNNISNFGKN